MNRYMLNYLYAISSDKDRYSISQACDLSTSEYGLLTADSPPPLFVDATCLPVPDLGVPKSQKENDTKKMALLRHTAACVDSVPPWCCGVAVQSSRGKVPTSFAPRGVTQ